jgi:hypothetical protein
MAEGVPGIVTAIVVGGGMRMEGVKARLIVKQHETERPMRAGRELLVEAEASVGGERIRWVRGRSEGPQHVPRGVGGGAEVEVALSDVGEDVAVRVVGVVVEKRLPGPVGQHADCEKRVRGRESGGERSTDRPVEVFRLILRIEFHNT